MVQAMCRRAWLCRLAEGLGRLPSQASFQNPLGAGVYGSAEFFDPTVYHNIREFNARLLVAASSQMPLFECSRTDTGMIMNTCQRIPTLRNSTITDCVV